MKSKTFIKSLIIYSFIILFALTPLLSVKTAKADSSSSSGYTTALEDLAGCKEFMEGDFPQVQNDYSVNVITIGESANKELFIYVYQPSAYSVSLKASSINISTESGDNVDYMNYKLKHISSEGVYQKYKVENFKVQAVKSRCYNISTIFRKFDSTLDKNLKPTNENIISEIAYEVSKEFIAKTNSNGDVEYATKKIDVVTITSRVDGFLQYSNGFKFFPTSCRSHYVAFSTDYNIDDLLEADVYYLPVDVQYSWVPVKGETITRTEGSEKVAKLTYSQTVDHEGSGWFAKDYHWERIQSVNEFISTEDLTENAKAELSDKEWVLRFVETEFSYFETDVGYNRYYTDITDVTILRLKFRTGLKTYNLGVVDNKGYQPGTARPGNNNTNEFELLDIGCFSCDGVSSWIWITLACIGIIIILVKILKNNGGK